MVQKGGWLTRLRRDAIAATVLACLLGVLHHHLPVIDILDKFAFLFAASNTMTSPAADAATVVLGIDQKSFERDFLEQSPLDRCVLADKLRKVYAARPALLVIDFDVSPSLAGMLGSGPGRLREQACETGLYDVITAAAADTTRTILLAPFPVDTPAAQTAKAAWRTAMSAKGIQFGVGTLPIQFGFVQQQYLQPDTLASLAHAAKTFPRTGAAAAGAGNHEAGTLGAAKDEPVEPRLQLLNFRAFGREVRSLSWDEWQAAATALPLADKTVFLGSNYGIDDRFVTPVDELYGVNLHAAAFVSLDAAITAVPALLALAIDIAIGIVFGWLVGVFWDGYLRAVGNAATRSIAFLNLWLLVLLYVGLIGMLGWVAVQLIVHANIWISPLPMALGMALDAFILGAVHAAVHAATQAATHPPSTAASLSTHGSTARTAVLVRAQDLARTALGAGIVLYALMLIRHH